MKKETLETTTDNRVYKSLRWTKIANGRRLCEICGPHSGCNYWNKKRNNNRNWKKYRNKQYKN